MKKRIFFFAALFQISCLLCVQAGEVPHRYPFPVYETGEIVETWLTGAGFMTSRTLIEGNALQITGVKEKEVWIILVKPQSPLASSVTAKYTLYGEHDQSKGAELWTFLEQYTQGSSAAKNNVNKGVPESVLNQSESIVCIKAEKAKEPLQFSGFFIDESGLILSTAHDLEDVLSVTVMLSNGKEYEGYLVRYDSRKDLALIDLKTKVPSAVSLRDAREKLKIGERVYAFGCPANHAGIVQPGTIDGPERRVYNLPIWQVDMEVLPGSSGSPVFDEQGNLTGVVKGRYRGGDAKKGYVIPIKTVRDFLEKR